MIVSGRQIRHTRMVEPWMTVPRLNQILGLMRLNLKRHSEAKHNGLYDKRCDICQRHLYHIAKDERALDALISPED